MAKRIIILEEAWMDVDDAGNYYERISSKLRRRFEEEFILNLEKLETGVVSFKLYKQTYRCVSMASFPFKIYYKRNHKYNNSSRCYSRCKRKSFSNTRLF